MKIIISVLFFLLSSGIYAQELFTWSEPASNMAAKAIGFRATNTLTKDNVSGNYNYYLLPEIMFGLSGKIMVHAEGFINNSDRSLAAHGAALYLKYRFFSMDEIHSHLRMAFYTRTAINNSMIKEAAIELNRNNSGYEAGFIITKLSNKIAFSATAGLSHATDNTNANKFSSGSKSRNAINYTISSGKLMLPKSYENYKQTNMNLLLEMTGQINTGYGKMYLDLATAVQFIIISQVRIDAGYRFAVIKDLMRNETNGFLLRLEYNIFNAYK